MKKRKIKRNKSNPELTCAMKPNVSRSTSAEAEAQSSSFITRPPPIPGKNPEGVTSILSQVRKGLGQTGDAIIRRDESGVLVQADLIDLGR